MVEIIDISEFNHNNAINECDEEFVENIKNYKLAECTICKLTKKLLEAFGVEYAYFTAETKGHMIGAYTTVIHGDD